MLTPTGKTKKNRNQYLHNVNGHGSSRSIFQFILFGMMVVFLGLVSITNGFAAISDSSHKTGINLPEQQESNTAAIFNAATSDEDLGNACWLLTNGYEPYDEEQDGSVKKLIPVFSLETLRVYLAYYFADLNGRASSFQLHKGLSDDPHRHLVKLRNFRI